MKKKIILIVMGLALFISCQDDDTNPTQTGPVSIEFTTIEKNFYLSPYTVPSGNFVVNSQAELDALTATYTGQPSTTFPATEIDFNANTLIMAIDGHHSNLGYYLDIVSVIKYENGITVDVNKTVNPEEEILTMESRPYHLVTIPKTTLPVTFE